MRSYSMPVIPDSKCFLFDFYFCMGCFYSIGNGLIRSEQHKKSGQENHVFPSLYSIKTSGFAKKMANVLRGMIKYVVGDRCPSDTLKSLKKQFTGKSLRQGSITTAAYRGILSLFELCARSGHSTGLSIDYYIDQTSPLHGLKCKYTVLYLLSNVW